MYFYYCSYLYVTKLFSEFAFVKQQQPDVHREFDAQFFRTRTGQPAKSSGHPRFEVPATTTRFRWISIADRSPRLFANGKN